VVSTVVVVVVVVEDGWRRVLWIHVWCRRSKPTVVHGRCRCIGVCLICLLVQLVCGWESRWLC
jgi:hypothetical protein